MLAGFLVTYSEYSGKVEIESNRLFAGQTDSRFSLDAAVAWHLDTNISLRLSVGREKLFDQYINDQQLILNWYF